ncbi:MAG TPA: S-methyl-5'-thioadenosine phosphorylase [bacterium]|nr:S-methyl-5'-thioadenosine phosphorylase [bacterium]HOL46549.1 S-methyl-5'-thioadenosine phosphorylase [bacterium]HPQ17880.1 S-methyl-5'-thioadenosine phosphorylase [bacterium]
MKPRIGIIGGSGVYEMDNIKIIGEEEIDTPFGKPSDKYVIAQVGEKEVVFLPRHGKGHRILPSEVNSLANIYGMKKLGVKFILAVSAVGSLKEEIAVKEFVIPDQIIDKTKYRNNTYFGNGLVVHVGFAHPFCEYVRKIYINSAKKIMNKVHEKGIYVCMEGPQFSTKAESELHRSMGASVIGMTALPEAKIAREAEICYALMAMITDYDCWHETHEIVSADSVVQVMKENAENAKKVIYEAIISLDINYDCDCHHSLANSIVTDLKIVPEKTLNKLDLIIKKYLQK